MPITLNGSTGIIDDSGNLRVGTSTNTNNSRIVSNGVVESTTGGFRFPDGTTQTTAASGVPTTLYAIGTYVTGRPQDNAAYAVNTTIAGSSLYSTSGGAGFSSFWRFGGRDTLNNGATLVNTGTWRCVSPCGTESFNGAGVAGLWVRIS